MLVGSVGDGNPLMRKSALRHHNVDEGSGEECWFHASVMGTN